MKIDLNNIPKDIIRAMSDFKSCPQKHLFKIIYLDSGDKYKGLTVSTNIKHWNIPPDKDYRYFSIPLKDRRDSTVIETYCTDKKTFKTACQENWDCLQEIRDSGYYIVLDNSMKSYLDNEIQHIPTNYYTHSEDILLKYFSPEDSVKAPNLLQYSNNNKIYKTYSYCFNSVDYSFNKTVEKYTKLMNKLGLKDLEIDDGYDGMNFFYYEDLAPTQEEVDKVSYAIKESKDIDT